MAKAVAELRKAYADQQRQRAEQLAAENAAALRATLERQAELRATLSAPLAALLPQGGGLPSAVQRGAGVAPFEGPREAAERLRRQQRTAGGAAGLARQSASAAAGGVDGDGDADMADAGSTGVGGDAAAAAAADAAAVAADGVKAEAADEGEELEGGDPRSTRPVPPQALQRTQGIQHFVGGKAVALQVSARAGVGMGGCVTAARRCLQPQQPSQQAAAPVRQQRTLRPARHLLSHPAGAGAAQRRGRGAPLQVLVLGRPQPAVSGDRPAHVLYRWVCLVVLCDAQPAV